MFCCSRLVARWYHFCCSLLILFAVSYDCLCLLQVVYEALSDAGYSKDDLLDSDTAVFINLSTSSDVKGCEEDGANASSSRSSAEQISSTFGLRGPSVMLAAGNQGQGEVGGLVTLDLALRCIRSGAVSRALVVDGDYMGTTGNSDTLFHVYIFCLSA